MNANQAQAKSGNPQAQKQQQDEEVKEEKQKKNFLQKFFSYFKYNPKIHKKINHSLLFNSYVIFGMVAFYRFYLADLKLDQLLTYYIVDTGAFSLAGFIPHVSNSNMMLYQIMIFFQILAIVGLVVIAVMSYFILTNVHFVCVTLQNFYESQNQPAEFTARGLCSLLRQEFFIWLSGFTFLLIVRAIGNWLGWRAYSVLRKRFQEQDLKRKRKLRYIKLKKQIQAQKEMIVGNRKI